MTNDADDATPKSMVYPQWICSECGMTHGRRVPTIATWHGGQCDVCGSSGMVTEPRDFGHLKPGWQTESR